MKSLASAPAFRILLPFIIGILLAKTGFGLSLPAAAFGTLIIALVAVFINDIRFKLRWIKGLLLATCFILLGNAFLLSYSGFINNSYFENIGNGEGLILKIIDQPQQKPSSYKSVADVLFVTRKGHQIPSTGKTLLYISNKVKKPQYGDVYFINKYPQRISAPLDAGEFDRKSYLANQNIYTSAFYRPGEIRFLENDGNAVWKWLFSIKQNLETKIDLWISPEIDRQVAKAILLGESSELDQQTRLVFSTTGTIHVLAVSGLHLGIIMLFVNTILLIVGYRKISRIARFTILLLLCWIYAAITGFSPSICRAALMFTLFLIAFNIRILTNFYNILSVSALILLIINPFYLFQIGFQLSYAALLGIVWLQPKIASWLPVNGFFLKPWRLLSASVAAQVLTLPIILYYFHQFPVYFAIANLIIIPLSFCAVFTGTIFLMCSFLPYSWPVFVAAKGFIFTLDAMQLSGSFIQHLHGSLIDGLNISLPEAVLLAISLIAMSIALSKASKAYFKVSLATFLLFLTSFNLRFAYSLANNFATVHAYETPVISVKNGNKLVAFTLAPINPWVKSKLKNFAVKNGIHPSDILYQDCLWTNQSISIGNQNIIVSNSYSALLNAPGIAYSPTRQLLKLYNSDKFYSLKKSPSFTLKI